MNYKYSMMNKAVHILTEQEHQYVVDGAKLGREKFFLRSNKLMINLASVGSVSETKEPVDEREELLRLAPAHREEQPRPVLANYSGFEEKLNADDRVCAGECGRIVFIPAGDKCLPCSRRVGV